MENEPKTSVARGVTRQLFWIPALLAAFCAALLGVQTAHAVSQADSVAARSGQALSDVVCPAPHGSVSLILWTLRGRGLEEALVAALLVALALTLWLYRIPRRAEQTPLLLVSLVLLALTAAALGMAAYLPGTVSSTPGLGPFAWVLNLFLGNVTPEHVCGQPYPVGFETAEVAAIVTTGGSVLAGASATWQAQWVRLTVRRSADLDVVVGLDELTVPIVRRLVKEAQDWRRRDEGIRVQLWSKRRPKAAGLRGWLPSGVGALLAGRPRVVVIAQEKADPLISLARSAGALVWVVDLRTNGAMRRLVLRPRLGGSRIALRRMFILGRDQFQNTAVHDEVTLVMREASRQHIRNVIPRVVVRMDDPREAAEWRVSKVSGGGTAEKPTWFSDAVSQDEVMAHNLADLVEQHAKRLLVLIGDSHLALALLEELSLRHWARHILRNAAAEYDADYARALALTEDPSSTHLEALAAAERTLAEHPDDAAAKKALDDFESVKSAVDRHSAEFRASLIPGRAEPALQSVLLMSESAEEFQKEWEDTQPPLGISTGTGAEGGDAATSRRSLAVNTRPVQLVVRESGTVGVVADDDALALKPSVAQYLRPLDALVILTEDVPRYARELLRASRAGSKLIVAIPDPDVHGVGEELVEGGVVRYGPSWLMSGAVIEDSWGGLARLRHAEFRQRWVADDKDPSRETQAPWTIQGGAGQLSRFFQSDNLRQLRKVMQAVEECGYRWVRLPLRGRGPEVTEEDIVWVARKEHERWRQLREEHGWTYSIAEERSDPLRRSNFILDWDEKGEEGEKLRKRNTADVRKILEAIRATGLVPTRPTHRRTGRVRAQRLEHGWTWTEENGATLTSKAGDWRVTDLSGNEERGVAAEAFDALYEPVEGTTEEFARKGHVSAWEGHRGDVVVTLEGGIEVGSDPQMIVYDGLSAWPVPQHTFDKGYERLTRAQVDEVVALSRSGSRPTRG